MNSNRHDFFNSIVLGDRLDRSMLDCRDLSKLDCQSAENRFPTPYA